jgi:hypothetical protein
MQAVHWQPHGLKKKSQTTLETFMDLHLQLRSHKLRLPDAQRYVTPPLTCLCVVLNQARCVALLLSAIQCPYLSPFVIHLSLTWSMIREIIASVVDTITREQASHSHAAPGVVAHAQLTSQC